MNERPPTTGRRDPLAYGRWVDPVLLDRDVARRTVQAGSLLVAVVVLVFAGIYLVGGSPVLSIPTLITGMALIIIALARFPSPDAQLAAAVAAGQLLLGFQVFLVGDVNTGLTVWFLVPSLAAMIRDARRLATASLVFTASVLVVVALAKALGWPIIGHEPMPFAEIVMAVSAVGSLLVIGVIAQISLGARRRLISEVSRGNAQLADALEETEAARTQAVAAAEAKDRFFANLTHEIRTPLNGIAGTTELLRHTPLTTEQRPLVDALAASNENLVALVNAMLDHARLRAGHVAVDLAPCDLRRQARDLADLFGARAAERGLALTVRVEDDVPAWLETDAIKVRQIVGNLVANAIKFTPHGSVSVIATMAPPDAVHLDPRLVVTVTDTGAGIPPELAGTVFEPFVQGDASIARRYGGTGLGLAIASQLTGLLDGTLAVRGGAGGGSIFTLAVPVRVTAAPAAHDAGLDPVREPGLDPGLDPGLGPVLDPGPEPGLDPGLGPVLDPVLDPGPEPGLERAPTPALNGSAAGIRVLLAEDNQINRIVALGMLRHLGAEVSVATNGAEAAELAAQADFGVILMDLQMPGMDGIEAARVIRRAEEERGSRAVPIVAMTGNDHGDYGDACDAAGMNGFLMKPVDMVALRELLARVASAESA